MRAEKLDPRRLKTKKDRKKAGNKKRSNKWSNKQPFSDHEQSRHTAQVFVHQQSQPDLPFGKKPQKMERKVWKRGVAVTEGTAAGPHAAGSQDEVVTIDSSTAEAVKRFMQLHTPPALLEEEAKRKAVAAPVVDLASQRQPWQGVGAKKTAKQDPRERSKAQRMIVRASGGEVGGGGGKWGGQQRGAQKKHHKRAREDSDDGEDHADRDKDSKSGAFK